MLTSWDASLTFSVELRVRRLPLKWWFAAFFKLVAGSMTGSMSLSTRSKGLVGATANGIGSVSAAFSFEAEVCLDRAYRTTSISKTRQTILDV